MQRVTAHLAAASKLSAALIAAAALATGSYGAEPAISDASAESALRRPGSSVTLQASPVLAPSLGTGPARQPEELPRSRSANDDTGAAAADSDTEAKTQASILLRAARNSVAIGDLPEALFRFEKLLRLTPGDYRARFEYAGLLMQAGRLSEARRQLDRVVAEQQSTGSYRLALANLLIRLKQYESAREQLNVLLSDPLFRARATIDIARCLALQHRTADADAFIDAHRLELKRLDAALELEFAQLLIDLERPDEAVERLTPLYAANRDSERILATLLLAKVHTSSRLEAMQRMDELERRPLKDWGLWFDVAAQLYQEQYFPEALKLYRQALRKSPEAQRAALGVARTYLRLYEVDRARGVLAQFAGNSQDRDVSAAMADYHTVVGEFSEAIAIARQMLQADADDVQAAILLGNVYHASRQFALADATYSTALARLPAADVEQRREIRRLQAKNDLACRRFDRAIATLDALIKERPSDIAARLLLIEALMQTKRYDVAAALTLPGLESEGARDRLALDTQRGYVLLKQRRWQEAAEQFRRLAGSAHEFSPDVAYGLLHAATMSNQPQLARQAMAMQPSSLTPAAVWAVKFSGRAMGECDCESAALALDAALRTSPENIVLLNMRGEAAQQCDCGCEAADGRDCREKIRDVASGERSGAMPPANRWFAAAAGMSPTNVPAHLGLARSFRTYLAFGCAYAEYSQLLRLMPDDVNLIRETARVVETWRGLECASPVYVEGQAALSRSADADATPAATAGPAAVAPEPIDAGEKPVVSYFESQLLSAEYEARDLRGWRLHAALPAYEHLIDMEPSNEAAMFDLAQCESELNRTQCAVDAYERLLDVDPCNKDASTALWRNQLEMQPKLLSGFDYEDQRGRQGLANMTWYNYTLAARRPLGDENEFVEVGYRERILQPTDDRQDFGEIPYFRCQQKYAVDSLAFLEVDVEKYQYGLKTRPTFTAGIDVLKQNDTEVRISGFLKNYYVCGEAVRQDIYTTGLQIDGVWRPRRLWTLSGYYRAAYFSDNNWVNWVNLNSAHLIWQGRRQLRGLVDYNFYTFAQQTIFGPIPGSLVGTIHPYWSPSGYSVLAAGLELKQWFSCDTFKGANEHFCTIYSGAAVDSNAEPYFLALCHWQYDQSARLTWNVDANLVRSQNQVYNAVGAAGYGVLRLW